MSLARWVPCILCLIFLGWHGSATAGQLDKLRLQAQKLTGEVNEALTRARALEASDPTKARTLLRDVLVKLEDAAFMPEQERRDLESAVRNRIDRLTRLIQARRGDDDRAGQKTVERDPVTRPPAQQPPKGTPGSLAGDRIKSSREAEDHAARIKAAREAGLTAALNDTQRSANIKEERFTPYYLERAMKRAEGSLTKEEKTVLKALNSVLTPDFDKVSLKEVVTYLMDKTGVPILVDENSLKDAMVDYENDKFDFRIRTKVSVRTVLRKLLHERGLAYVIKEGNIHVVTANRAREMMVTRAYPVADLIAPNPRLGPLFGQLALQENVRILIQTVMSSTDPTIWQNDGRPGGAAITFHQPTMSLVVRAPAEMHLMMGFGSTR